MPDVTTHHPDLSKIPSPSPTVLFVGGPLDRTLERPEVLEHVATRPEPLPLYHSELVRTGWQQDLPTTPRTALYDLKRIDRYETFLNADKTESEPILLRSALEYHFRGYA